MPKRGIKAVPRSIPNWQREVDGVCAFISRCQRYEKNEGRDWVQKMQAHYGERLRIMCWRPPASKSREWARAYCRHRLRLLGIKVKDLPIPGVTVAFSPLEERRERAKSGLPDRSTTWDT